MSRYYDMDKLAEMAQAKADTLLPPGNIAFSSVAKWLELLPAADVAPKSEIAREIFAEIESCLDYIEEQLDDIPDSFLCVKEDISALKMKYSEVSK